MTQCREKGVKVHEWKVFNFLFPFNGLSNLNYCEQEPDQLYIYLEVRCIQLLADKDISFFNTSCTVRRT